MRASAAGEERLVRGLRSGDPRAFRQIYDAYHPAIYNLCARIVGDREEARDLTQETFLRAFSTPPEPRAELGLRAWLYRVATNLSLNHLRASRGVRAAGDAIDQVASQLDPIGQARTVALVEETLGQLNARYRTALILKDLHGLPSEELASVMETSRASADVLVHRARASFRSAFSRLAGEGRPAPGDLAAVLVPLAVPASLRVMPPLPHAPTSPVAPHTSSPPHGPASAALSHGPAAPACYPAGPLGGHTGGLLARLSSGLGSKVAIAAATAGLVVGGVATERMITDSRHDRARAATAPDTLVDDRSTASGPAMSSSSCRRGAGPRPGDACAVAGTSCGDEHLAAGSHHAETGSAGHATDHGGATSQTQQGATAGHDATSGHDSGTGTTTAATGTTSGGHDGGSGTSSGGHDASGTASGGTGAGMGGSSDTHDGGTADH